ncbi:hypothetical protein T492DRAFT_1028488 [Pavlovales sp. CCMP2436]|nr:hypothetical protein T492DRAFT_1028488 [Pavlovales sp. CCMP2436]
MIDAYLLRDSSGRFRFDLAADELGPLIAFIAPSDVQDDRHLLRAGDRVKLIDGHDCFGLDLAQARAIVRQVEGPMLKLYATRSTGAHAVGQAGESDGAAGWRSADLAVAQAAELLAKSKRAMHRPVLGDAAGGPIPAEAFKALEGFGVWLTAAATDTAEAVSLQAAETARRLADAAAERGVDLSARGFASGGGASGDAWWEHVPIASARGAGGGPPMGAREPGRGPAPGRAQSGSGNPPTGSGMPARAPASRAPGCVCDMRGWRCPVHPGTEQWRQRQDYAQAIAQGDRVLGEPAPPANGGTGANLVKTGAGGGLETLSLIDLS